MRSYPAKHEIKFIIAFSFGPTLSPFNERFVSLIPTTSSTPSIATRKPNLSGFFIRPSFFRESFLSAHFRLLMHCQHGDRSLNSKVFLIIRILLFDSSKWNKFYVLYSIVYSSSNQDIRLSFVLNSHIIIFHASRFDPRIITHNL